MMAQNSKKRNMIIAGLAVAVILLASSTVYFATAANQNKALQESRGNFYSGSVGLVGPSGSGDPVSGGGNVTREIAVSGTGEVSFTPTQALIGLSVMTQNSTAGEATAANAAETTAVIKALNSVGITNSSIKTTSFDLSPQYNYIQGEAPRILSFEVTNSLQVNITGSSPSQLGVRAGQVIDTGVGAGANQVSLQFTAPNSVLKQLDNQALQQAVSDASTTAQTIAGALGVSVTGVLTATTGSYYTPQPIYNTYAVASALTVSGPATPIMPGTMTVTASVQVTYGIS